jgi:Tol biopolymer transport system component
VTAPATSSVTDLARFAVSGEGRMFAFSTNEGIELRDAGQREYRILQGTKSGESPAFSPDGDWIAYETSGVLRKTPVAGGASLSLIANDSIRAGRVSWGDDGTIVFETGGRLGLMPPNGSLRILAKTQSAQQPRMTPDGRGVLYVNQQRGSKLMYYDLAADTTFVLLDDATEAQYLLTGQLIYASTLGGLYTIRFDPSRHTVSGTPTAVILDMQPNGGVAPFVVTRSGTLVYRAGVDAESRVLLRSAEGKVDTLPLTSRIISYLRFSPDGRRLALSIGSTRGTNRHVALYDFSLGTLTHFTNTGGVHSPVWSPDGSRLAWTMEGPETNAEALVVRPIDQSRPPMRMPALPNDQHATAWPSDTVLVFSTNGGARTLGASESRASSSIVNPLTRTGVRECLNPLWAEYDVAVSPDGQWAAYTSNESGQAEIMVRRFPRADEGGKWKLSSDGGRLARWSADGRTIYHLDRGRTRIRAVGVTPGNNFSVGASSVVMTARQFGSAWDVDRKTGRIAITVPVSTAGARMVVMQNWRELFSRSGKK